MWGRSTKVRLAGAVFVALCLAAGCGGRSQRHGGDDGFSGSGGDGGAGGSSGGSAGTLTFTGGTAGTLGVTAGTAGAAGSSAVLRPCGNAPVPVELLASVVIVLDASEVMNGIGADGQTHFERAREAIVASLGLLSGARVGMAVASDGGKRGACSDVSSSVAPAPLDTAHRRTLEALLDDAVPGGPSALLGTHLMLLDALETSEESPLPATLVVVGSGSPAAGVACGPSSVEWVTNELEVAADRGRSMGIETAAVGVAGTMEERAILAALAIAGGTAPDACDPALPSTCYYDVPPDERAPKKLQDALRDAVLRSPAACRLALGAIPSERTLDPELVTFSVRTGKDVELLERVEPGPCERGWYLEDPSTVVLCTEVCDEVRWANGSELEVALACDGVPP